MALSEDDIRKLYEDLAFTPPDPDVARFIYRYLPTDRQARLLDAGCGDGRYSRLFASDSYTNITAIDLFKTFPQTEGIDYRCNSITAIDLPDQSVDFLYSMSVLYYLDDPTDGLREFFRVMKPGSKLVISAHTKYSLFTLERKLQLALASIPMPTRLRALLCHVVGDAEHLRGVRFYSATDYCRKMQEVGFVPIAIDGFRLQWYPDLLRFVVKTSRRLLSRLSRSPCNTDMRSSWPMPGPHVSAQASMWRSRFRSVFAYHCLLAAEKPNSANPMTVAELE